jgi:hypothetical protein
MFCIAGRMLGTREVLALQAIYEADFPAMGQLLQTAKGHRFLRDLAGVALSWWRCRIPLLLHLCLTNNLYMPFVCHGHMMDVTSEATPSQQRSSCPCLSRQLCMRQ